MPDDDRRPPVTDPAMIPQPYPLWCAQASREHGATVGRIIGWIPATEDENATPSGISIDYLPIIASQQGPDGTFAGICPPVEYEELFIGDDPGKVLRQAREWLHSQGVDTAEAAQPGRDLDSAMHSVWLLGDWRFLTSKMTSEEREAAAAAVERHGAVMDADDPEVGPVERTSIRWWTV